MQSEHERQPVGPAVQPDQPRRVAGQVDDLEAGDLVALVTVPAISTAPPSQAGSSALDRKRPCGAERPKSQ